MQVNRHIIEMAQALYECDRCVNKHAGSIQDALKEVSDTNFEDWDPVKLASALKIICYPDEKCKYEVNKMGSYLLSVHWTETCHATKGQSVFFFQVFTEVELSKLQALGHSLEGKFFKNTYMFGNLRRDCMGLWSSGQSGKTFQILGRGS